MTMVIGLHDRLENEFMGGSTTAIVDLHDNFGLHSMLTWVSRYVINCKGVLRFGNYDEFGDILSCEISSHRCIFSFRIGMHCNIIGCLTYSGLQGRPFDREGVFDIGHSYLSQSYVIYFLCMTSMCMIAYTCTDIYNLICMNAHACIDICRCAFCIQLGSSAIALESFVIVRIV